ncbi:Gfo/Idh/MocA family oxidoreductase [Candidatus Binatia bacterium]|nr:Gfo/Idh/MocA family oxidoreductase [Candidatus Binatia bacterium]
MIGIAVVGAGHWGPNLIRNFDGREESVVRWVCDRDAKRLAEVQRRLPHVSVGDRVEQALADPLVDAVVIATPTKTHHQIARAALEQGKHVLVEKPLAASTHETADLCDLAERSRRVLMVGHVFVFNAAVQRVREILDRGDLGHVHYVSMVRTNLGPIRTDVSAAWDLAAHDVSIANYWLGVDAIAVSATGSAWVNPGIEDAVFATIRYRNDVLVNLHVSWLNPRKVRDVTVVGERRMLTFDDMNPNEPLRLYDKQVTGEMTPPTYVDTFGAFRSSIREGDITIPRVPFREPLKAECDHFLACIRGEHPLLADGRAGHEVVRVLEAMHESIRRKGAEVLL